MLKKGQDKIREENKRQVVVKFNFLDDEDLFHIIGCIIDMELLSLFIRTYSTYDLSMKELNTLLINDNVFQGDDIYNEIKKANDDQLPQVYPLLKNYLDSCCLVIDNEENERILSYLNQHPEKKYQIYFTIEDCHKNDYVFIFVNESHRYHRHKIIDDINKLDFFAPRYLYGLYRIN